MGLLKMVGLIIGVVVLVLIVGAPTALAISLAKPGCPDRCGNLTIPYPFGVSPDCYHDEFFFINCTGTGKAFLRKSNMSVSNILLDEGELEVMQDIAYDCYDSSGRNYDKSEPSIFFSKFWISTKNKFTAIGCDTIANIRGFPREDQRGYGSGCISTCYGPGYITNGSCSGIGCCQTSIPTGVRSFMMRLSSYDSHTNITEFNPCSYAFVVQEGKFNFSLSSFTDLQPLQKLPLVLDWAIGNLTCYQAKSPSNTNYACTEHSDCVDVENVPGYRCICSEGYQGNPYLPNGCQDIDECEDPDLNRCKEPSRCVNTIGNYTCSCPKGYHGDGRKDGQGCTQEPRDQLPVILTIGIGSGLGGLFLILGTWELSKIIKKRKETKLKREFFKRNGGLLFQQQQLPSAEQGYVEKTKLFTSKELEKATDHYNENRILGRGGQGTVYKGMLTDGKIVAVKKSKKVDEGKLEEFINEVVILSQINHRNVVKLHGCCLETKVPLLVYEFIPNGTLFEYIHDQQNDDFPLSWDVRLRIASEVAGALAYLHSAASVPIYHRDIKSSNILLDDKYRAKVADFGTSRSVSIDQTHMTTKVQGTFGYFDPEYFQSSKFTAKSDVYSFGVVLLELLTGQKAIMPIMVEEGQGLAAYFISSMEEDRLFDILNARVLSEGGKEEISAVANLARRCLNLSGKRRPTMQQVAMELEAIRTLISNAALPPMEEHYDYEEEVLDNYIITKFSSLNWDTASTSITSSIEDVLMSN